jgi:homoserine kinase
MEGICKRFGATQALRGVSLEARAGEVLALIGENGAGKSTLMKVLSGAIQPDAGQISLGGKPFSPRNPHQARLAGIALAVHFGKLRWPDSRIVGEASRREHHPDNAAACWMGGLAVARMSAESEAQVASIIPKGNWPLLLAVPEEALATEEARRVLPAHYSRADAVSNVQNSMLLLASFVQGRRDLLAAALEDRMHQPYRAPLCPLLPALQMLVADAPGILGVALSGAGPSVLIFLDDKAGAERAKAQVRRHLQAQGLRAELMATAITKQGAGQGKAWLRRFS